MLIQQPYTGDPEGAEKRGSRMNRDSILEFIIDSLRTMNYDVEGIGNDTELGPRGADLESLALAELAIRVEDRFAVTFDKVETGELAVLTVGEFCEIVAARTTPTALTLR
jgi:acyl carrier protein